MANYYLDDIADFLSTKGFPGATIDYYQPLQKDQICLLSLASEPIGGDQFHVRVNWQILVTSSDKQMDSARKRSYEIMKLLQDVQGMITKEGEPVLFYKIQVESMPYFLGLNQNKIPEFTTLFSANIRIPNNNSIYQNQ